MTNLKPAWLNLRYSVKSCIFVAPACKVKLSAGCPQMIAHVTLAKGSIFCFDIWYLEIYHCCRRKVNILHLHFLSDTFPNACGICKENAVPSEVKLSSSKRRSLWLATYSLTSACGVKNCGEKSKLLSLFLLQLSNGWNGVFENNG